MYVGNGEPEAAIERVENRRLADSAVAHESARLSLHGHAKRVETFPTLRRAEDDGHQLTIRLELRQFLLIAHEIDLVHAEQRLRAAALDGDEESIDEPRPQRRRFHRDHVDHDVQVRCDEAMPMWVVRIGTRQNRAPRQDGFHRSILIELNAIADRERTLLPYRHFRRDDAVDLLAILKHSTAPAGHEDDDGCILVDIRRLSRCLLR